MLYYSRQSPVETSDPPQLIWRHFNPCVIRCSLQVSAGCHQSTIRMLMTARSQCKWSEWFISAHLWRNWIGGLVPKKLSGVNRSAQTRQVHIKITTLTPAYTTESNLQSVIWPWVVESRLISLIHPSIHPHVSYHTCLHSTCPLRPAPGSMPPNPLPLAPLAPVLLPNSTLYQGTSIPYNLRYNTGNHACPGGQGHERS